MGGAAHLDIKIEEALNLGKRLSSSGAFRILGCVNTTDILLLWSRYEIKLCYWRRPRLHPYDWCSAPNTFLA